jgi:uncharacterized protein YabN with tetrapyrrole methylase and pyrophosphatase domain
MLKKSCGIDGSPENRTVSAAGLSSVQYDENFELRPSFHEVCRRPKTLLVDALQSGDAVVAAAPSHKRFVEKSKVPMLLFDATVPAVLRLGDRWD